MRIPRPIPTAAGAVLLFWLAIWPVAATATAGAPADDPPLDAAQYLYYDGQYEAAVDQTGARLAVAPDDLAALELRTAARLFQVKRLIGEPEDRGRAVETCAPCPAIIEAFLADVAHGRTVAKARLAADPVDREAQFYLGKLDLNYIWLYLGPLGKRTGWSEYREARHTLDDLLEVEPDHVRARVARAWIDYIVDTRVSWMFRWVLGGGDRDKALRVVREAAVADAPFYTQVEARFALWEMLSREKQFDEATAVAHGLLEDFPRNKGLLEFVAKHPIGE